MLEFQLNGLEAAIKQFQSITLNRVGFAAKAANIEIAAFIAERATANAPIREGHLRRELNAVGPMPKGNTIKSVVIDTIPYAFQMHEQLMPYGSGPYRLGPRSRAQPFTPEGGVGGKYVTRVVLHHRALLEQKFAAHVEKALS